MSTGLLSVDGLWITEEEVWAELYQRSSDGA